MIKWRRAEKAFTCNCCAELVILGWAGGHAQYCDNCIGHLDTNPICNGKKLAEVLNKLGTYVRSDAR